MLEHDDDRHLSWLTKVPTSDINFKVHLEAANVTTLRAALEDPNLTKTARKAIEGKLRRRERERANERR
jgi:hypothetical protein